jgi:branched-chain amino acid aminotransferase
MDIRIERVPSGDLKPLYEDPSELPFGGIYTDRMFTMSYERGRGWFDPAIVKYAPFQLDPAALVLHYGQEIFEGLKAFLSPTTREIRLFRAERNALRFSASARRMCMPEVPVDDFLQAVEVLVNEESRWMPRYRGASMYIRPTMIATEAGLGVRPSKQYVFYVILSPSGPYYKEGFNPISLLVADEYVRAVRGGVGEAKTGGNYAASLLAGEQAKQKGYSQVLWLDAIERKYVEEVGAMNMFFVFGKTLVTSPLTGSILRGVTRDSVLTLAPEMGYCAEERMLSIDEVVGGAEDGTLTEVFGAGTAASISPVGTLEYRGTVHKVGDGGVGPVSQALYDELTGIQYGERDDRFGWTRVIGTAEGIAPPGGK